MMTKGIHLDGDLRKEYGGLFTSCKLVPARRAAVAASVKRLLAPGVRARHEALAAMTSVPWFVIAVVHSLESGGSFERHLHNGDPLGARTVRWPKNRPPAAPPFTWEQSAADALALAGLSGWDDWGVAGTLFKLEAYNGFGYRMHHPEVPTPYLWSFTDRYTKGKYAADRRFDPELVSQQPGAVALFLGIEEALGEPLWPRSKGRAPAAARPAGPMPYPGRVIRRGEANRAIVTAVQSALLERNCGPLEVDGLFGPGTEESVKLFQARSVNRYGVPLGVDGVVGPVTWEILFGEKAVVTVEAHEQDEPLVAAALAVAETQVGVTEAPPFKNTGEQVGEYLQSVGLGQGYHWCAAFVHWCFAQAAKELGVANPLPKTGHCMTHWREAGARGVRRITAEQAHADPSLLMPGQVFIMHYGADKGHTGFVASVQGGLLETIEGNTNTAGSRNGDGVYRKLQRRIEDINVGFIDYAGLTPAAPATPPAGPTPPARPPVTAPGALPDVAPLDPAMKCAGLLAKAVDQGAFEPPIWVPVKLGDLTVSAGAHALRASVGGRLLRLPVSYKDVIAICNKLGWIPPTVELSDAIWDASTVKLGPVPMGDRSTPAASAIADRKMLTLEFVIGMNTRMDGRIPKERWGELAGTEGKDWILSRRNVLHSRGGGPGSRGVANYGWHQLPRGEVIQGLGADSSPPWHDDNHYDYSQTLRPIQRMAKRPDGSEVDLLDVFEAQGMPAAVLAPFRAAAPPPRAPRAPAKAPKEAAKAPKRAPKKVKESA